MSTHGPKYAAIRRLRSLCSQPIEAAMTMAALLVDGACDLSLEEDLEHAILLIREHQGTQLHPNQAAELHYFLANAWSGLRAIRCSDDRSKWKWKQPEMENELLSLRSALRSEGFGSLPLVRRAQILTNTGNLLNNIGRSLEALFQYDKAIRICPGFGMAVANRGFALKTLACSHYDVGQRELLLHRAWRELRNIPAMHLEPGAKAFFEGQAAEIQSWLSPTFLSRKHPFPRVSLGRSKREQRYREWALQERLFLCPLVALGSEPCAARDTLNLPPVVAGIGEGPGLLGMFTQIKQEFVSARLLAWEGLSAQRPHFSDRETHLVDTLDHAVYGLALEKVRIAYRMAYSILDKVALLLNWYSSLGIPESLVSLKRVWFVGGDPNKGLSRGLVDTTNWSFRGLFWLARDLFEKAAFAEALEPEARNLKEIRDHLEHKYLKVHDLMEPSLSPKDGHSDQYAKSVRRGAIEAKTLTILRLACCAITYLSLGVHAEERMRGQKREARCITPPMFLPDVPDDWKR